MAFVTMPRVPEQTRVPPGSAEFSGITDVGHLVGFVRKRASASFAVKVVGAGLGFVVHLVIARSIGLGEYGTYALMLSWISVLAVVAQCGQDNGVLHFLPTYAVSEKWGLIKGLRIGSGLLVLAFSLLISVIGVVYVHWHHARESISLVRTFDVGFILLPVLAQLQQSGALHRALKHAAESDFYVLIVRPLVLALLVVLAKIFAPSLLRAPIVAGFSLTAAVAALIWSGVRLCAHWAAMSNGRPAQFGGMRAWVRVGAQLSVLSVMMATSTTMGSLVIGAFLGAGRVGPYYAAVQIAGCASFGYTAINTILAPMIAEYYAAGKHHLLAQLMRSAARMTFLATTLLTGVLALLGHSLLRLFGPGFSVAYVPLLVLLVGEWLNTCAGSVGFLLTMTRFQRQAPLIFLCGLVSSLLLAGLSVPKWGLIGMAASTVTGWTVWNVVALAYVYRNLGLNPTVFQRRRPGSSEQRTANSGESSMSDFRPS